MKKTTIAVRFLALLLVIFLSPVLFRKETFFIRDILTFFHPQQSLINECLQKGEFPLWNPYGYSGMPLVANWQSRVFSPLSLFFYLFGTVIGLKLFYLACMFLSAFFCFVFFRSKGFSNTASLTAATLWLLNGYFITKLEFFSVLSTLTFTFAPFTVVVSPVLSALALSFAFMGGYPIFFLILFCYFVMALTEIQKTTKNITTENAEKKSINHENMKSPNQFRKLSLRNLDFISKLSFTTLAIFWGIIAVQLIPTAELVLNSTRSGGVEEKVAFTHSLKFNELRNIVFPSVEKKLTGAKYHWIKTSYLGVVASMLLIFVIYSSLSFRGIKFLGTKFNLLPFLFLSVGILLSLGDTTPVYPFLYRIFFPLRLIRYPSMMLFFVVFGATLLIPLAVDKLKRFKVLVLIFITAELFFYGYRHQETAKPEIFFTKPQAVDTIRQGGYTRFILTPKTRSETLIKGETISHAWLRVRETLKGFTSWPYHIFDAYGIGEPLTPQGIEEAVDSAYSKRTPDDAFGDFENMGVSYLVSNTKLQDASKFILQNSAPPFIYKSKSVNSIFYLTDFSDKSRKPLEPSYFSESRIKFNLSSFASNLKSVSLVHLENYYPGWQAYIDGHRVPVNRYKDYYKSVDLPKEAQRVVLVYRPPLFGLGVLLTVAFVLGIVVWLCKVLYKLD